MSVNKVLLIGNVGKDPDVRYLNTGVAVANFPLATSDRAYVASNGTQIPERTEWHNIVIWGNLAETVEKYVRKGDKLWIEGKIRTRSYSDKNGIQRYVTEIFADSMEMLSPKGNVQTATPSVTGTGAVPGNQSFQRPASNETASESVTDDLPF